MELSDTGPPPLPGPAEGAVTPPPAGTASCFVCHLCLPCLCPGRPSLSPLRLCLCSASFLDCCVLVSCLRLAVSLGLSLMAPPLRSCPEYPLRPFSTCSGPDIVLMQTRVPASTRSLMGRRLRQAALPALKAPDPALGRSPQPAPQSAPAGENRSLAGAWVSGPVLGQSRLSAPRQGVSAHAQSPLWPRPEAPGVGSLQRVLGGGGTAWARAQKAGAQSCGELKRKRRRAAQP